MGTRISRILTRRRGKEEAGIVLPIIDWRSQSALGTSRRPAKKSFSAKPTRNRVVTGSVREIHSPDGRRALDPDVKDHFGLPIPRFCGTQHPETVRTSGFMRRKSEEWPPASGAERVWSYPPRAHSMAAGTCRMGHDPRTSVTAPFARVHGHDNLYIADASLHVTNGDFNPVLTVMALAFQVAETIAKAGFPVGEA